MFSPEIWEMKFSRFHSKHTTNVAYVRTEMNYTCSQKQGHLFCFNKWNFPEGADRKKVISIKPQSFLISQLVRRGGVGVSRNSNFVFPPNQSGRLKFCLRLKTFVKRKRWNRNFHPIFSFLKYTLPSLNYTLVIFYTKASLIFY